MDAKDLLELNTAELRAFGCTSKNLVDALHNLIIDSWAGVVENHILPYIARKVQPVLNIEQSEEMNKIRQCLLDRIFLKGKLELYLSKLEGHLMNYIFSVPRYVTLPEDRNQSECPNDEEEMWTKIETLSREIVQLRYKIQILDSEKEKAANVVQVMRAFKDTISTPKMDC